MIKKLLINPAAEPKECTEPKTGIKFRIRAVSPELYDSLRAKSARPDHTLDVSKWGEEFADAAIAGWGEEICDANGSPAECNEKNRRAYGRSHAVNIMPWIIDKASDLDQFRLAEEVEAKKG
ncbi:MAG: hypothetical protein PHF58_10605 [Methylotenera sp.]|nr:hypothetical protein [Methylotenera sp.]